MLFDNPLQDPENTNIHNIQPSRSFKVQAKFELPAKVRGFLLILGGDFIQKAIIQLAGHLLTPVTFSFGWVAYAPSALATIFLVVEPSFQLLNALPSLSTLIVVIKRPTDLGMIVRVVRDLVIGLESRYIPTAEKARRVRFNKAEFIILKLEASNAGE